jgi:SAM-dependent methyltransferase
LLRVADLQTGERVLDVACGTGLITRLASERVGANGTVTGVDIAPDMIDVAKRVPAPNGAAIQWRVADAAALPTADASVDVVSDGPDVSGEPGRGHHRDGARAGAVRPGGDKHTGRDTTALRDPGAVDRRPHFPGPRRLRQRGAPSITPAVAALLPKGGLRDVSARAATATFRLPVPAEFLWQYINLTPMAVLVQQAPEPAKVAMEEQFVVGVQPYVIDGTTVVEQPMVIATGRA